MTDDARRIIGVETEYGLHHAAETGRALSPEEVARTLFQPVVEWGRSSNVFLVNGSRLYLDVGSHPEYATAECSRLEELIATDRAGDLILADLVARAERRLHEEGFSGTVHLYRNNADSAGHSYGSHENYLLRRTTEFRRLAEALIPFLVTRQLIAGAGRVVPPGLGPDGEADPAAPAHYAFSQRADHVQEGISSATTRSRPIINTRDEPHADAALYRRLHVIVGDTNMSQTTQLVRFGSTDLILRMIEAGYPLSDRRIANPTLAIRQVSHDLTGTRPLELREGTASALDLQRHYLERATAFVEREGAHHEHVARVLDLWERTLTAVETQDPSGIDTEIDWAVKLRLLERYRERSGAVWDDPRLARLELAYHDVAPGRGLFGRLEESGQAAVVLGPGEAEQAREHPPATTRAALRGRFITAAREAGQPYGVDWTTVKLTDRPLLAVSLKDPFATSSDKLDRLLDELS